MKKAPDVILRKINDVTLLLPMRSKNQGELCAYQVNELGAYLWDKLDFTESIEALVEDVCKEFSVDHKQAHKDVSRFVKDLKDEGVLI